MSDAPENLLFVVLDTVRKDHLTPYGYDRETTPGLEEFATEATVFEEAVAPAPWTLPVHASLFTGQYPSEHGADQETPYLDGATTLAESLSAAGYDTACFSSNAWITPYTRLTAGFDAQDNFFQAMPGDVFSGVLADAWQFMNDSDRLRAVADKLVSLGNVAHERFAGSEGAASKTPAVLDSTRSFVEASDSDRGWFAFVNLMDAHLPYYPPEEHAEQFAPGVDSTEVCQNSKEYNCGGRDIDADEWASIRGLYDGEIAHMDAELRQLFDWLKETDRWDDTAVVVCADHGELHGEQGLYGHEFGLYDPIVNVPLLIKHPALDDGRRTDQVELVDLYHTVLDLLDVEPSDGETVEEIEDKNPEEVKDKNPEEVKDNEDAEEGNATDDESTEAIGFDPTRSLLREEYRAVDDVDDPDPGQAAVQDRRTDGDDADYAFIEYAQPVIELNQLEEKASKAGVELDEKSRYYARMRAARRPDAKYVRRDRVSDEAIDLGGTVADDVWEVTGPAKVEGAHAATERALAAFERRVGGAWTDTAEAPGAGTEGIEEMDEEAQERLRDLGYLE